MGRDQKLNLAKFSMMVFLSGVNPEIIRGSKTGVFIGAQQSARQGDAKNMSNGYALIGNALSMFPNRLSYFFDFKGMHM